MIDKDFYTNMKFNYAIQNKNGLFYRGSAYGNQKDWTNIPMQVFTYSYEGAMKKLHNFPIMFKNCTIKLYTT